MHLCFICILRSLVVCGPVFFLGILVLKKDTDVTHVLFGVVSLVLMSHLMNLNPISLLRLLVTVLLLVFLSHHLCLLLTLLRNHSRYIVASKNLKQRPLPRLMIWLPILPLFQLLCTKVSILVPLTLSLSLSLMVTCLHLFMPLPHPWILLLFLSLSRRLCPSWVGNLLWRQKCLPCLKMPLSL